MTLAIPVLIFLAAAVVCEYFRSQVEHWKEAAQFWEREALKMQDELLALRNTHFRMHDCGNN